MTKSFKSQLLLQSPIWLDEKVLIFLAGIATFARKNVFERGTPLSFNILATSPSKMLEFAINLRVHAAWARAPSLPCPRARLFLRI